MAGQSIANYHSRIGRLLPAWCVVWIVLAAIAPQVHAQRAMVAAANPHAAAAGLEMLEAGGSAVDAAIAIQLVLGLVEPQSSGIGGGAFLLHFDSEEEAVRAYDGRETAPAAAAEDLFLDAAGEPMGFWEAAVGGRAVGVPGLLRLFELVHDRHGRLPWPDLFAPAIELAERGFEISPRLAALIAADRFLDQHSSTASYFLTDSGVPKSAGTHLVNPDYAETLRVLARDGAGAFYRGELAEAIVAAVQGHPDNPGAMTLSDLDDYRAVMREPLCRPYRLVEVCGMPPPTSGGTAVLQILGILENFDLSGGPEDPQVLHLLAEAGRLAFADRNAFLADSDFVDVPLARLLDATYLRQRAALIDPLRAMESAEPGRVKRRTAVATQFEPPSTSHLVVIDDAGSAVSMTSSIESAFGARLMVGGFLLNNQLTDFSFRPEVDGVAVANAVAPGKRPRSSMAPLIVRGRDGQFLGALGSPGGSRIIGYVVKATLGVLDWGLAMQEAIELPNAVHRGGALEIEAGTSLEDLVPALRARGHEVEVTEMVSGLHGLWLTADGLQGGADPRREGVVLMLE